MDEQSPPTQVRQQVTPQDSTHRYALLGSVRAKGGREAKGGNAASDFREK